MSKYVKLFDYFYSKKKLLCQNKIIREIINNKVAKFEGVVNKVKKKNETNF